jgi:hypothetical protein
LQEVEDALRGLGETRAKLNRDLAELKKLSQMKQHRKKKSMM